jgi:hypothetical protein
MLVGSLFVKTAARSGGRSMGRAALLATCLAVGAGLYVACSLPTMGVGPRELVSSEAGGGGPSNISRDAEPDVSQQGPSDGGVPACSGATCAGGCVDLARDPAHCGQCGRACASGEQCTNGECSPLCIPPTTLCGTTCVTTTTDPAHCGACNRGCPVATPLCSNGACQLNCAAGLSMCTTAAADGGTSPVCVDLQTDQRNCGQCGRVCAANEICDVGTCRAVCAAGTTPGDFFTGNMVGCTGRVGYNGRGSLCPNGVPVCTASEYVQKRGGKKPTFNYWVDEYLRWTGSDGNCAVGVNYSGSCYGDPMRVCGASPDALGNYCRWEGCGFQSLKPNEYFGGCQGNKTAGTLCCAP